MTTDTILEWRSLLKGKIADDILELKDARGNEYFDSFDLNILGYFAKHISDAPWANHLALYMVVSSARNLSPKTVKTVLNILSNRLKDLFAHFALENMDDFNPDVHMYAYLKNKFLSNHSIHQRAFFLKRIYHSGKPFKTLGLEQNLPRQNGYLSKFPIANSLFRYAGVQLAKTGI